MPPDVEQPEVTVEVLPVADVALPVGSGPLDEADDLADDRAAQLDVLVDDLANVDDIELLAYTRPTSRDSSVAEESVVGEVSRKNQVQVVARCGRVQAGAVAVLVLVTHVLQQSHVDIVVARRAEHESLVERCRLWIEARAGFDDVPGELLSRMLFVELRRKNRMDPQLEVTDDVDTENHTLLVCHEFSILLVTRVVCGIAHDYKRYISIKALISQYLNTRITH